MERRRVWNFGLVENEVIKMFKRTKKIFLPIFLIALLMFGLISNNNKNSYNFEENKSDMEYVANEILKGNYEIGDDGLIELSDKYEQLADTGTVCMVLFKGKPSIYFWTYRGMLGSSKGYVYMLNTTDTYIAGKCSDRFHFVNVKEISDGWYSVSTDD